MDGSYLKIKNPREKPVHGGHCTPVVVMEEGGEQSPGEKGRWATVPLKFSKSI